MSYILDALRKADADRERGTVPGIHAQPMFAGAPQARAVPKRQPMIWAVSAAALLLLAALLMWALRARDVPATQVAAAPVAAPAAVPMAVPIPAPTPAPIPAPAPAPIRSPIDTPMRAPPVRTAPAPEAARVVRKPAAANVTAPSKPVVEPALAGPAANASEQSRVFALTELPEDIRRQLPSVNIGGSMYSGVAANRILIINGQVLHEGDRIAPDLVLQQIKLKSAVLAFKGYRYAISF